ncbi:MAG: hypothetical protein GWN71_35440, partial [Gammaproteobacteria bacterium]|nr:hypothetical protein [Gammaproteobacteria bacterium]
MGALRGGPAIVRPGATNFWFGFYSDNRRPLGLGVNGFGYVEDETDGSSFSVGPSIRMRPSSRVELSLGPRMSWNTSAWQYVTRTDADAGAHYVFARLEQRTASLTTRLSYAFTPALSLQLYAQPFVAAGDYEGFMEVADPRADGFDARFRRY